MSFEQVQTIVEANEAEDFSFFLILDRLAWIRASSRFSDKDIIINNVPIVEAEFFLYCGCSLQAGADLATIQEQLKELKLRNKYLIMIQYLGEF